MIKGKFYKVLCIKTRYNPLIWIPIIDHLHNDIENANFNNGHYITADNLKDLIQEAIKLRDADKT